MNGTSSVAGAMSTAATFGEPGTVVGGGSDPAVVGVVFGGIVGAVVVGGVVEGGVVVGGVVVGVGGRVVGVGSSSSQS